MIINGKELALKVRMRTAQGCDLFIRHFGRRPCLAVVLVGDDPASLTYVAGKKKACDEVGIDHRDISFDAKVSQQELLDCVKTLNNDQSVDGILVQLPLPDHINEMTVIDAIAPQKDVDGFTPANLGALMLGEKTLVACTPKGIMRLLDSCGINLQGKNVCIVGRSNIVGKPLSALMMAKDRNATVTVCNSYTADLKEHTKNADVIVSAAGKAGLITADMVKDGCVVIDVGMNRVPDSSKKNGYVLKGDVDFEQVSKKAYAITPVPGGVGPMTVAMLMKNTLTAACRIKGVEVKQL